MSDRILMDIIQEHLKYEINMLHRAYTKLSVSPEVNPDLEDDEQKTIRNAFIESFCVHARSLIYFLANKTMRNADDDAIAKEFTTGFSEIDFSDEVKELIKKLNKHIFHLTKKRTTIDADKFYVGREGLEATKIIEAAIERFERCLLPEFQPYFKSTKTPLPSLLPSFASSTAVVAGTVKTGLT